MKGKRKKRQSTRQRRRERPYSSHCTPENRVFVHGDKNHNVFTTLRFHLDIFISAFSLQLVPFQRRQNLHAVDSPLPPSFAHTHNSSRRSLAETRKPPSTRLDHRGLNSSFRLSSIIRVSSHRPQKKLIGSITGFAERESRERERASEKETGTERARQRGGEVALSAPASQTVSHAIWRERQTHARTGTSSHKSGNVLRSSAFVLFPRGLENEADATEETARVCVCVCVSPFLCLFVEWVRPELRPVLCAYPCPTQTLTNE